MANSNTHKEVEAWITEKLVTRENWEGQLFSKTKRPLTSGETSSLMR